jgi:hypothetical protein
MDLGENSSKALATHAVRRNVYERFLVHYRKHVTPKLTSSGRPFLKNLKDNEGVALTAIKISVDSSQGN